jgi:hypothetical protein
VSLRWQHLSSHPRSSSLGTPYALAVFRDVCEHEVAVGGERVLAAQRPVGGPEPGNSRDMKSASRDPMAGSGSKDLVSGSTTGPPQSCAALTVASP